MTDPRVEQLARKMCGDLDPDERVYRYGELGRFSPPANPLDFGPRWWRFEEQARLAVVAHDFFEGSGDA